MKTVIKNPLNTGLSGILSTFTKTQKKLEEFLKSNAADIKNTQLELDVMVLEQEKATKVSANLKALLDA